LLHFFRYTCHEIVSILEDEDAYTAIFIQPNDGCASDEYDGDLIDNLTGSQLNAPAEALLSDGRRITGPHKMKATKVTTLTNFMKSQIGKKTFYFEKEIL